MLFEFLSVVCVFEGHVRDWRQKIQRTKSETGKVKNIDVWLQSSAVYLFNKWSSRRYSSLSLPQRKRTSQSNNKEGRCGAHCKYANVHFHARLMSVCKLIHKYLYFDTELMIMLTDGRDGDFASGGGAQSQRTHGQCGGGADCTHQLSGCDCFEMHGCIGLPSSRFWWPCSFHTVLIL